MEKEGAQIIDKDGWDRLVRLTDEVDRVVKTNGDFVCGKEPLQEMIVAVREENVDTLKKLANLGAFPFRKDIQQALQF